MPVCNRIRGATSLVVILRYYCKDKCSIGQMLRQVAQLKQKCKTLTVLGQNKKMLAVNNSANDRCVHMCTCHRLRTTLTFLMTAG